MPHLDDDIAPDMTDDELLAADVDVYERAQRAMRTCVWCRYDYDRVAGRDVPEGYCSQVCAESAGHVPSAERLAVERRECRQAMASAQQRLDAQADLERRAATDPEAALEIVRQVFRRYNAAVKDGTESERQHWRTELSRACAQYNVLAGRLTIAARRTA